MAAAILAIGSSSMEPGAPLPAALAAELGRPVNAAGVRGSRLTHWRTWAADAEAAGRDVLVLLGGNDPSPAVADVLAVEDALRSAGARSVVWIPPPVYLASSHVAGRDGRMRAALEAAGVAYVRARAELAREEYAPDLVHPTRAGAARWARLIAPELRGLLAGGGERAAVPRGVIVVAGLFAAVWFFSS